MRPLGQEFRRLVWEHTRWQFPKRRCRQIVCVCVCVCVSVRVWKRRLVVVVVVDVCEGMDGGKMLSSGQHNAQSGRHSRTHTQSHESTEPEVWISQQSTRWGCQPPTRRLSDSDLLSSSFPRSLSQSSILVRTSCIHQIPTPTQGTGITPLCRRCSAGGRTSKRHPHYY
jgi:hypothetical protein